MIVTKLEGICPAAFFIWLYCITLIQTFFPILISVPRGMKLPLRHIQKCLKVQLACMLVFYSHFVVLCVSRAVFTELVTDKLLYAHVIWK